MDPYWILHFLAFLAFSVREHFNVYKLAQKRILFPHGAWQPNNTKRKKHMFLVFPHFSQRTFSANIDTHIPFWNSKKNPGLMTSPPPVTPSKTNPHGTWKKGPEAWKTDKKHLSDNYPINFVEFRLPLFGCTEKPPPFHLFTKRKDPKNCRSVQLNGLKASMPCSRYVAHC